MSILSALFNNQVSVEQALRARDITTGPMKKAIQEWFSLYFDTVPAKEEDPCQRIPYVVVNKLTKTTFSEYTAVVEDDFLSGCLERLEKVRKKVMQFALIGGDCYIKPVLTRGGFNFVPVRRDCYLVLARNEEGETTSIGTAEYTASGGKYYTLLEKRTVDESGYLTIENRLFRSEDKSILGAEIPLGALPQYAALEPAVTLSEPLNGLGMALLKTPMVNCVDGSDDSVSVYAPATGLIHNINRNEAQINGEFERGQSRIIASADMMELDESGERRRLVDNVFTAIDDAPDEVGITIFSPALREQSFLARKTEYLRNVESQIGLKRGILSEVEAAERTATEITSSEGDYNLTIIDFQQAWEAALREAMRICCTLGYLYKLCPGKEFDPDTLTIDWGNGVLYDRDKAWAERKEMVAAGLLKPELALAWYFNLPCKTPSDLMKIRRDYMPEIEAMTGGD